MMTVGTENVDLWIGETVRDVPGSIFYRVPGIKTVFLPGTEYRLFNKLEKVEEK